MRHLLNPLDFTVEEIDELLELATDIERHPDKYAHVCDGKKLATLFYEPSTRTRLSFEGKFSDLTVGLCGDLKFGRTVHSLINALSRYERIKFILISPPELRIPGYIRDDVLVAKNIEFKEVENLDEAMPDLDILYMTRVQKERFFNEEDYIRMKDCYILDKTKMKLAKDDMLILHPLPRVNEISVEVDDDPRAAYFKQAQYGVYVRMALIMTLLEVKRPC